MTGLMVAVEGCLHGELCKVYEDLHSLCNETGVQVDLLICCGDFQALRNETSLNNIAVPNKYKRLCDFHLYYTGQKVAPVLTIFIGGNHEDPEILTHLCARTSVVFSTTCVLWDSNIMKIYIS
eukprot:GHVS01066595.1.p1 GENE.GHVS01066595.1~~GHVS01066595.1.p1  ORF type:complete len:123 (-),score=10.95 GHVS01066595.1:125-493(-)